MKYFNKIGDIDTTNFKSVLQKNPDWDNEYTIKRQVHAPAHAYAKTLPLQWSYESGGNEASVAAEKTIFWDKYFDSQFFDQLEDMIKTKIGDGYFIRILFTRLLAGAKIPLHADSGESLIENHRVHVPIVSNDKMLFQIEDEIISMKEGEVFEIDNSAYHAVQNNSSIDRIHLIVDWHCN